MITIDEIKNECLGWTGLQSLSQQGQFAQRAAKALPDLIDFTECIRDTGTLDQEPQAKRILAKIRRTWEESK